MSREIGLKCGNCDEMIMKNIGTDYLLHLIDLFLEKVANFLFTNLRDIHNRIDFILF